MDEKNNPENWQTDSRLKSFDINLPYNRFHFEWNITPNSTICFSKSQMRTLSLKQFQATTVKGFLKAWGINSYFKQNSVLRAVEHVPRPILHDVKEAQSDKNYLLVTVGGLLFWESC